MAHCLLAGGCQDRVLLVFDLAVVVCHLRVVRCQVIVEVLFVVNGQNGLAKAARSSARTLALDGADTKAVTQEQLLVEGGCDCVNSGFLRGDVLTYQTSAFAAPDQSRSP